jgi:hypothetical protein
MLFSSNVCDFGNSKYVINQWELPAGVLLSHLNSLYYLSGLEKIMPA